MLSLCFCSRVRACRLVLFAAIAFNAALSLAPAQDTPSLINFSTRGAVGTGGDVMIAGFIISGTGPRRIAVRALGPSLTNFGLTGVLADPVLNVYSGQTVVATNDDWQTDATSSATLKAESLAPTVAQESALVVTLNPGPYTAIITGKNNTTGLSLAEVYDLDARDSTGVTTSRTVNLSTRGRVGTGANVMIMGFIIGGTTPRDILISAVAGSLAEYGITDALTDSQLEVHDSTGNVIATNDDWIDSPDFDTIASTGASPRDPLEAAVWLHLQPGAYTAIVSGVNNAEGVALPEVNDVRSLQPSRFAPTSLATQTAKLVISGGSTPVTLSLAFADASTATVNSGANGTYTYTNSDNYRSMLNVSASGYTLSGTLQFYRQNIAVFSGTMTAPGASSQTVGGIFDVGQ